MRTQNLKYPKLEERTMKRFEILISDESYEKMKAFMKRNCSLSEDLSFEEEFEIRIESYLEALSCNADCKYEKPREPYTVQQVKELREYAHIGMNDAKLALAECGPDYEKCKQWVMKRGLC